MKKQMNKKTINLRFAYGYGLGEFGFTFFNFMIAYYLMYFLTDIICLPMRLAAVLYTTVQWVEVITMLLAGVAIDKASLKTGKYSPWAVGGSIFCAVSTILFFFDFPVGVSGKAVLFFLFYSLAYVGFNVMWVAYRTLLNPLCRSPKDTVAFATASSQMSSIAGLIFSMTGAGLLNAFTDLKIGYLISALVYGVIMVAGMLTVSKLVKPYEEKAGIVQKKEEKVTLKELARALNAPMVIFFFAVTFRESVQTVLPTLLVYYFTYTMGHPEWMAIYLTTTSITTLLCFPLAEKLAVKYGKKTMFLISSVFACVILAAVNFTGESLVLFLVTMVLFRFCCIFSGTMIPAFMNDIAVYNEATYGIRSHAFNSAIGGGAIRLSQVVGGALASFGLVLIGYSGKGEMTAAISSRITGLMTWGSIVVILISSLFFLFYKLDEETLEKAYETRRKRMGTEAAVEPAEEVAGAAEEELAEEAVK